MSRIWTWAWWLGACFFVALALYYAARIGLHLHERSLSVFLPTPENASLLMRMGQYKPLALKPPFNGVVLLAFPLLTLVGMGLISRGVVKGSAQDNERQIR